MATWEDGPEYAPLVRPDSFALPDTPPLEPAPPPEQPVAAAPAKRPHFSGPSAAVVPLAQLLPEVADRRDPQRAFEVASSTLTSMDSAWGSAHWSDPSHPAGPGAPAAGAWVPDGSWPAPVAAGAPAAAWGAAPVPAPAPLAADGTWSTPPLPPQDAPYPLSAPYPPSASPPPGDPYLSGTPYPQAPLPPQGALPPWGPPTTPPWSPSDALSPPTGPAQLPAGYPPPGTPQWFGPGPGVPQPPAQRPAADLRAVVAALTPGLLITLAVGCVLSSLAPVTFCVALALSVRVRVAAGKVRATFLTALAGVGLFAMIEGVRTLLELGTFSDWWAYLSPWCRVISVVTVLVLVLLVRRELRDGPPPAGPPPSRWG